MTEEAKSVSRQIEQARAYAARKGWTVGEEHAYVDDGISGAEFERRPALLRLLNALKPRPSFGVLIVMRPGPDRPRTDRDGLHLKLLARAGVRVFECKGTRRSPSIAD